MFRLVFLCTGNRARSAIAEGFVRQIASDLPVEVSSAGLLDLARGPALPEAIDAVRQLGLDLTTHVSRPLKGVDISRADLVIGFERQHMAGAVVDANADPDRTFLLKEFVRLLDRVPRNQLPPDPGAHARQLVAEAASLRSEKQEFIADDEIGDPYGLKRASFDKLAAELHLLSAKLVTGLFEGTTPGASATDFSISSSREDLRLNERAIWGEKDLNPGD